MDAFAEYISKLINTMENGEMANFPDPGDPADLGDPLTQDEIDFVKKLKKEIEERFTVV